MDPGAAASLIALLRAVLGCEPERIESFRVGPDGPPRATHRLHVDGRVVYATRRERADVTAKEARILEALGARGAPVPRRLAFEDGWLLQESVGAERLAQTLNRVAADEAASLLRRAVGSLASVQAAGRAAHLAGSIPSFAHGNDTAQQLLATLTAIGTLRGRPLPALDRARLAALLAAPGTTFIKWDARPSNAALGADGVVRWFDWQHANCRHATDDLVWLLCDEFVPEDAAPAALLVETADAWGADPERVMALAVAHVGVRLHGILSVAGRLETSWDACLAGDWLGSRESARRLAQRGAAVARRSPLTRALSAWFAGLAL